MKKIALILWLSLLVSFFLVLVLGSFALSTANIFGSEMFVVGILLILPGIPALVNEIGDDFQFRPIFSHLGFIPAVSLVILGTSLLFLLGMSTSTSVFLFFLMSSLIFGIDGRPAFGIALILLIFCMLFLLIGEGKNAESASIYVYYFLVIGVVNELFSHRFTLNHE